MPLTERIALIAAASGADNCWIWPGGLSQGYGRTMVNGRQVSIHRFAYELLMAPIPSGLQIDHLCRNRACFNPRHMEAVPQEVNKIRGRGLPALNRLKTHCANGHPLSGDNCRVFFRSNGRSQRVCLTCKHRFARAYKAKHRKK